ncbi:M6 family metalloprotease domain-containing protein [Streptomyces glomeratus]|uniref:M6 family metalloprotease domain-containing protein n=1 Tax=Streptomyces glomeratus TaxID=284452 RepID=A0ABP6M1R0_9ACTN|nr:M6 family metalloprotease domain-containing protein [Streptomyces glomeratus]MCF1511420.1 M6 family metalloprotease domain-containing protein [Streptomyces glomeratus]
MPCPLPSRGLSHEAPRRRVRSRAPLLRKTVAAATSMTALAATSLVTGPAVFGSLGAACQLTRSQAHHSEGVDTWNAAYTRPTRPLDAVLVFLSFPDSTPTTTPAELTSDYFPATSRFFDRASYGRFTVHPHPLDHWIRMPRPSPSYAVRRDWDPEHRSAYLRDALAVSDREVDFSRYDVVYFVADPDAPGIDSDATKVVNLETPLHADGADVRRVVTVFEKHPPDHLVLAHETGHVFDLPDLYHRPVDGKGDWDTYVGDWDLMGSQFGLAPDLFAWHKWKLGWLDDRQVVCVRGRGSKRLTLEPLAAGEQGVPEVAVNAGAPPASGTTGAAGAPPLGPGVQAFGSGHGTKLAVVRTGVDSVLALEARDAMGNDSATCTQGVLVYRVHGDTASGGGPIEVLDAHPHSAACWNTSVYPSLADAPLDVGESFTVPDDRVRVDVEDRTPTGAWTVRVTRE